MVREQIYHEVGDEEKVLSSSCRFAYEPLKWMSRLLVMLARPTCSRVQENKIARIDPTAENVYMVAGP